MIFVPIPLFATLFLGLLLVRFLAAQDMRLRAHQLFAGLIAGYAAQSCLTALRWGYDLDWAGRAAGFLAPALPVLAFLAFTALSGRLTPPRLWPLAVLLLNWAVLLVAPMQADPLILVTYLGFGALILDRVRKGSDRLSLSPLGSVQQTLRAMALIGLGLIGAGVMDLYVIYDFIRNEGRNAGFVLSFVQTGVVLAIGAAAVFGQASAQTEEPDPRPEATETDAEIMARLTALFDEERLHLNEDISLRRLSRRLGVPDRQVSGAINRSAGISVSKFVNRYRIEEACTLLRDTDRTVLEISLASGFASKSNFNREFTRVTGKTPSEWRKGG